MSGSPPKSGLKIRRKSAKSQSLGGSRKFSLQSPDLSLLPELLEWCYVTEKLVSNFFFGPKRKSWWPTEIYIGRGIELIEHHIFIFPFLT